MKYSVHAVIPYRPEAQLENFKILMPDTGSKVMKVRAGYRPTVDPAVARLMKMFTKCFAHEDPLRGAVGSCECCSVVDNTAVTCCLCLRTAHIACSERLSAALRQLPELAVTAVALPDGIAARAMCVLCNRVVVALQEDEAGALV